MIFKENPETYFIVLLHVLCVLCHNAIFDYMISITSQLRRSFTYMKG